MDLPHCSRGVTPKDIEAMLLKDDEAVDYDSLHESRRGSPASVDQADCDLTDDFSKLKTITPECDDDKLQEVPEADPELYQGAPNWEDSTQSHNHWQSQSVEATYSGSSSPKERFRRDPGVMGLMNIGNTCFMNAGLQCLLNTPALVEFFLLPKPEFVKASDFKPVLLHRVCTIFSRAWGSSMAAFDPTSFKECLGRSYSQFQDNRQHDCQEFLALLLDLLHEQLLKCQISFAQKQLLEELWGNHEAENNNNNHKLCKQVELRRTQSYSGRIPPATKSNSPEYWKSRTSPTKRPSVSFRFPSSLVDRFYNRTRMGRFLGRKRKKFIPSSQKSQFYLQYPDFQPSKLRQTFLDSDGEECNSAYYNINRDNWERHDETRRYGPCPRKRPRINSPLEAKRKLDFHLKCNGDFNGDAGDHTCPIMDPEPAVERKVGEVQSANVEPDVTNSKVDLNIEEEGLKNSSSQFWEDHLKSNNTIIARTFQGFLKSTVTCTTCSYVSAVFEPFMYFSLPLPNVESAFRVLSLRLIRLDKYPLYCRPIKITCELRSTVGDLKANIVTQMPDGIDDPIHPGRLYFGSVCDFVVTELMDDLQIQNINDRNILYMYELNSNFDPVFIAPIETSPDIDRADSALWDGLVPTTSRENTRNGKTDSSSDGGYESSPTTESRSVDCVEQILPHDVIVTSLRNSPNVEATSSPASPDQPWELMKCSICYENCPLSNMVQHSSGCVFCKECVQKLDEHSQYADKSFKCPKYQCSQVVRLSDFHAYKAEVSGVTLTQISYRNVVSDSSVTTFGHPVVIRIPTCLPAAEFHSFMDHLNPFPGNRFRVYSCALDGKSCALCEEIQCRGCTFPVVDSVYVRHGSQIVFLYADLDAEVMLKFHAGDMPPEIQGYCQQDPSTPASFYRYEPRFDIHDCLREFAKEELLDHPWLCPKCSCHRKATKKLSVCEFPDYLIIHLKRFVYQNLTCQKLENEVTFPLVDLDLNPYVAEEAQAENKWKYNLYGCVSHSGTVSYGHYTAFTKNLITDEWNFFNDRFAYNQNINESCYSSAYILFYAKQGTGTHVNIPDILKGQCKFSPVSTSPSPGRASGSCSVSLASSILGHQSRFARSRHSSSQTHRSEDDYATFSDRSFDESRGTGSGDMKIVGVDEIKHHIRWTDESPTSESIPPLE